MPNTLDASLTAAHDAGPAMPPHFNLDQHLAELQTQGFTVIADAINPATLNQASTELEALLGAHRGRNDFEGFLTERVYTLVKHGRVFEDLSELPCVMALLDPLLSPGHLLTVTQAISMLPGETPQRFHRDDGYYPATLNGKQSSISTMLALDDFTAVNGATDMLLHSHASTREQSADLSRQYADSSAANEARIHQLAMPAGSCAVWLGSTLHRGGANRSTARRRGISTQYCNPWLRPQETLLLSVPRETAAAMSPRLQGMLGYDVLPPFMGHLTGLHPRRALRANE